jgi:hypothetical protein
MLEDMQLRGLAPKTQQAYIRAVRQLASSYDKSPDQITEEELRALHPSHPERRTTRR